MKEDSTVDQIADSKVSLDIPFLTFLKIFVAIVLAISIVKLYPLLLLIVLAAMLAFALKPVTFWLERKGVPHSVGQALVVIVLVGSVGSFIFFLIPSLFSQVEMVGERIGPLKAEALSHLPDGLLQTYVGRVIEHPETVLGNLPTYLSGIGIAIFNSLWSVGIFLIVAIYFLIDGGRAYQWFIKFFKPVTQAKLNRTTDELEVIVSAYVGGQVITSLMVAVYVFALNSILGVPGALMLAIIAGIFDVLPIIGFLSSTVCAFIMTMTVSPATALLVVALYLLYQGLENYVIVPRVYGKKMKLSTLVVINIANN